MRSNTNRVSTPAPLTHEGAPADRITPIMELRRSVMACLLWEDTFYESGTSIAQRIKDLTARVAVEDVIAIAIEAREVGNLRHVPLMLLASLLKKGNTSTAIKPAITRLIKRADELAEIIAIFAKVWGYDLKSIKKNLPAQLKEGIADAFNKFDEYQLSKYDRNEAMIRLRDVAFMVHWKPETRDNEILAAKLLNKDFVAIETKGGTTIRDRLDLPKDAVGLATADTWETSLSAGGDKGEEFTRLLQQGKLGYLALLRNLRNMEQSGVDAKLVNDAIKARQGGADKVFPFRFIAAARAAKTFEPALDQALIASVGEMEQMKGITIILVDISGSMDHKLSGKSDLTRMDAAAALASIFPGEDVRIYSFSNKTVQVPRRIGMGGVEAIIRSQMHGGTDLAGAVTTANGLKHDRLIVITDEQAASYVPTPKAREAYMINVASYQNGVGYKGGWKHIDGFSENVIRWIAESERLDRGELAPINTTDKPKTKGTVTGRMSHKKPNPESKPSTGVSASTVAAMKSGNQHKIKAALKDAAGFARGETKARVTEYDGKGGKTTITRSGPLSPELGRRSNRSRPIPIAPIEQGRPASRSRKPQVDAKTLGTQLSEARKARLPVKTKTTVKAKKSVKKAVSVGKKTTKKSSRKTTVVKKVKARKIAKRTIGKKTKRR